MTLEVFSTGRRSRKLGPDEVSLTKTNMVIAEELADTCLTEVTRVTLLFDPTQEVIGIRAAQDDERGYKISYRSISTRSFYAHFGITKRGRFSARVENGMILVSLRVENDL